MVITLIFERHLIGNSPKFIKTEMKFPKELRVMLRVINIMMSQLRENILDSIGTSYQKMSAAMERGDTLIARRALNRISELKGVCAVLVVMMLSVLCILVTQIEAVWYAKMKIIAQLLFNHGMVVKGVKLPVSVVSQQHIDL